MKIESKYKDYYDAGLVYWIDEKLYFKRQQSEEQIEAHFRGEILILKDRETSYMVVVYPLVVWFCKQFYPLYKITVQKHAWTKKSSITEVFVYTYEEFTYTLKKLWCEIREVKQKWYRSWTSLQEALFYKGEQLSFPLNEIHDFLNNISSSRETKWMKKNYKEFEKIFEEKWVAYFIIWAYDFEIIEHRYYNDVRWFYHFVTHPVLKDYKFSQVKDAYSTFQEISMFLWSMQNPDDKMLELNDKYIAYSKGFCSHSFKKQPTKSQKEIILRNTI